MTRWIWLCLLLAPLPASCWSGVQIAGRVVNDNHAPVPGARIELRLEAGGHPAAQAISDPAGAFQLSLDSPGNYLLTIERKDYFPVVNRPITLIGGETELQLTLTHLREVFESLDVTANPSPIETDRAATSDRVTNTHILEIPFPASNALRNALRVLPGIVLDNSSRLHVNGGAESQVNYTLDGFNVADPLTARFETRLSVEAVQSMELLSGVYPPEYGKGSAGTLVINTASGDDKLRYNATNFIPGFENHKGWMVGNYEPRFNVSGPISPGRAWFSDSTSLQYNNTVIEELPKGQDRTTSWRLTNLLHGQVNLTPSNILFTSLLVNLWEAPHNGLGPLDPISTTLDRHARQWFFSLKDQIYFGGATILELGYASNRTLSRETPQGVGLLDYMPDGRQGFAFINARRTSSRDQFLANVFLPAFTWHGSHRMKVGLDVDLLNYWQDVSRTGFEYYRADMTPARRVVFTGSGRLSRAMVETGLYAQDTWRLHRDVTVETGLRVDRDDILRNWNPSPRIGVAWAPRGSVSTKLFGGYSVVFDATNLQLFTRPFDQIPVSTFYAADGTPSSSDSQTLLRLGSLRYATPRSENWNAGLERRLPGGIFTRTSYLQRRGRRGFAYSYSGPTPAAPTANTVYNLDNHRVDRYHAVEFTLRQPLKRQFEWMASYRRSHATSSAVLDINLDDPQIVVNNAGPLDWDTPNRLLGWAYLPLPILHNWAVASLFEYHSGFPFSIQDEYGQIRGAVNSMRFPAFAELNLHLERKFTFLNRRWAWRFGFNNITNHRNYNVVNNNLIAPDYLRFYGGQSRAFNMRFRWLGKSD